VNNGSPDSAESKSDHNDDNEDEIIIVDESGDDNVIADISKLPTYKDKMAELDFDINDYVITNNSSDSEDKYDEWMKQAIN